MTYVPNKGYYVEHTIAADVADAGTFTVAYPTGTTQLDFNAGLYKEGEGRVVVNEMDGWDDANPGIGFTTFGASNVTLTNNTGATLTAGTPIRVWFPVWPGQPVEITVPVFAMSGISAADVVTDIRPGIDGYITNLEWVQGAPVTTAAKAATLHAEIGAVAVTGGAVVLTSAACTPLGAVVAGARITAANRITKADKLSIVAAAVTAFLEGSGYLRIRIQPDVL